MAKATVMLLVGTTNGGVDATAEEEVDVGVRLAWLGEPEGRGAGQGKGRMAGGEGRVGEGEGEGQGRKFAKSIRAPLRSKAGATWTLQVYCSTWTAQPQPR